MSVTAAPLLALVLCASCELPTGPDFGDPALFAFDEPFRFACDRWSPHEPDVDLGLFDVLWSSDPQASRAQRDRVLAQGGSIVYAYHIGMLRVIMPPAGVAALDAIRVTSVLDPSERTVEVFVGYVEGEDIRSVIERAGGIITRGFDARTLKAVIPDEGLEAVRRHPAVRYVEAESVGCLL